MYASADLSAKYLLRNRVIGVFSLLLWLSAAVIFPELLLADDAQLQTQQLKLQKVRENIQRIQEELEDDLSEHSQLEQQLATVEKQLNRQYRNFRNLQKKLRDNQRELHELESRSNELRVSMQTQQNRLAAQLRTAYFIGNQEQLKILLNQQDPSALTRILKYFDYLNRSRLTVLDSARSTLIQIRETQRKVEKQTTKLQSLTDQSRDEYEQIRVSRNKRKEVLASLQDQIKQNKGSVITLRQDETRIQELIATLSGVFSDIPPDSNHLAFYEQKGLLPWPVKGELLNRFGEARSGSDLSWRGIRIAAPRGQEVRAVSYGRVAFADWIPVFGLILLIDHGDGYMSLYAHNQSLYKDTGDWVRPGEVISNVGDSGGEERDLLYFEIRHDGIPLDPAKWCAHG